MNRKEFLRKVRGDSPVPSTRKKKNKDNFEPDHDFIKESMKDFTRSGGKIRLIENSWD